MPDPKPQPPATYWDYIALDRLLSLQSGLENDEQSLSQDEVVFITVHQVYELWFKLLLRDLTVVRDLFAQPRVPDDALAGASRGLQRILTILQMASDHWRLVETITPRDFLSFRDKLFPANGGQSPQFREIEILMGLEESDRIPYVTGGSYLEILKQQDGSPSWAAAKVAKGLADKPSLRQAVDDWLYRTPVDGSTPDQPDDEATIRNFIDGYLKIHAQSLGALSTRVQSLAKTTEERAALGERYQGEVAMAAKFLRAEDLPKEERRRRSRIRAAILFIEAYRELPLLAWPRDILSGLVAFEQAMVAFRQRHARMAERLIGRRVGTGGSSGVDYLDQVALTYRVFRDLWGVRTILVRREALPDPTGSDKYGFTYDQQ